MAEPTLALDSQHVPFRSLMEHALNIHGVKLSVLTGITVKDASLWNITHL